MSRPINHLVIEPDIKTHRLTVNFCFDLILKEEEKGKVEEK
jgi:hypothetical protein